MLVQVMYLDLHPAVQAESARRNTAKGAKEREPVALFLLRLKTDIDDLIVYLVFGMSAGRGDSNGRSGSDQPRF